MAHTPCTLMSSGSKKKEPTYTCLSEAKASHSHKICTEISSSVPHFLQVGLSLSPITCRCLLKVLGPVSRPITALDCVLLKDNNRAPVVRLVPVQVKVSKLLLLICGSYQYVVTTSISVRAWTGCTMLRAPRFSRQPADEGGKVVSPTQWPPIPPQKIFLAPMYICG